MKPARLVLRSLAFHARAHAATLAGVLVASLVLTGALTVGDSVRASLARAARARVGTIEAVLGGGERFFRRELGARLEAGLAGLTAAPAIQLPAVAATPDGARRVGDAQLVGVEAGFFAFAPRPSAPAHGVGAPAPEEAWIGSELARALDVAPGSELVLRVPRPSATTRELALVSVEEAIQPLRVRVARVLADEDFGAFALEAGAAPRANLFVAHAWLAERLGVPGRANRLFLRPAPGTERDTVSELEPVLRAAWEFEDVGLAWRATASGPELVSDQIFLSDALVDAARGLEPPPLALLGYFVNGLVKGARTTPYSTVVALGGLDARAPRDLGGWRAELGVLGDGALGDDELALNDWTARDLEAAVGDEVRLRYFALGSGRALEEREHAFRVRAIVPTAGLGADPSLSPDFPGIGDAENCRDWDPGIPLDLGALRDQDEEYWDLHRGAPKAFLSLGTARTLFGNRFGHATALRLGPGEEAGLVARLRTLDPGVLGLPLRAVSAASSGTSDFGALFLGLSLFLVVSALLLTALFFAFSVERRASELGVLRASGFRAGEVVRLQLGEALVLCAAGAALGVPLGLAYTRALLHGLESAWSGAVGRTRLVFAVEPATLALSAGLALLLGLLAVTRVLARARKARILGLLAGELGGDAFGPGRIRLRRLALGLSTGLALACLLGAFALEGAAAGGLAFGAGLGMLTAGLVLVRTRLARPSRPRSLVSLGWTNAARRPGRSLTTVALMASSVFLLVVAGASRQGPTPEDAGRESGTGGFAWLGRTNLPVLHDLLSPEGRAFYGLEESVLAGVELVPLRVRAGDEASCLNLDQARSPRILGVRPSRLAGRFCFAGSLDERADPWTWLDDELEPGSTPTPVVPVIVDALSLQWALHKSLGDELEMVDGRGRPFRARIVASLADSILQGDVLVSEARFETLFPEEAGHRAFLLDVDAARAVALAAGLSRALADEGLVLVPARERLDLLHGVQNTYLAIFQALGGLGLVLGSVGLLALVLRSAVERRAELGLLRALGFTRRELRWLFLGEQGGLVWVGLGIGALAGLCVVLPRLEPDALGALGPLALWLLAVGLSGSAWVWLGSTPALRGSPLDALQRE
jgi:putative ABC transport system permease protein